MKRKKPIPGVRLLLCALLAAAALVGVTQRAEAAYSEPSSSIIKISPQKVSDKGNCTETWWEWKKNSDYKFFRTYGPRGNDDWNKSACVDSNNKQSTEHIGALEFKNLSGTTGTLTIEYTYNHKNNSGESWFNLWIFPQDTAGNNVVPKQCNSTITPTHSKGAEDDTHLTAEVRIKPNESAYLVAKVCDNPGSSSRSYVDVNIFSVTFVQEGKSVNVTFQAPVTHRTAQDSVGSYTISYADAADKTMDGSSPDVTANIQSNTKVTLTATPTSGVSSVVFRDWYDVGNDKTLSTSATFDAYFSDDTTITARYIDLYSTPLFEVTGQTFTDLGEAIEYAQDNKLPTVRLVKSGGISGGTYIIPDGVTLLLPYEKGDEGIWNVNPDKWQISPTKDKPDHEDCTNGKGATNNYDSVSLTLKNTKLIVESGGAIEVGGVYGIRQGKNDGCFAPVWRYGWLKLEDSNSSITVQSGGKLYAWGYITGSGTVTAASGAELWELFQIMDWPGGTEATARQKADVFPFTQYYVQNIEAKLVLQYGAKEKVVAGLKADDKIGKGTATLIGSDGLFRLSNGAELRREYNTTKDRIQYTLSGSVSLADIDLSLVGYSLTVSSKNYVLPINGNTTVTITEGATLNVTSDTSLLPGTEVYIDKGGTLAVADNAHLYIYDSDQWNTYCYDNNKTRVRFQAVDFSPSMRGKEKDGVKTRPLNIRKESDLVDVKIDVNGTLKGNNIYTTTGGADVCSSKGTGKYVREGSVGTGLLKQKQFKKEPFTISITPIKLKNGNNSYTETDSTAVTYYYNKSTGTWGTEQVVNVTLDYNYTGVGTQTISSTQALPTLTRTGYTFTGWNTKQDGTGTPYAAGATCSTLTEPTTLYAQWEAKTYTLKLNDNYSSTNANKSTLTLTKVPGGTISQTSSGSLAFTVAYDDVIVLPQPTEFIKTNDGSTFLGWKPMWCKDGKTYSADDQITISEELVKSSSNDEIWIYAQWKREYYTVTAESRSFDTQTDWNNVMLNPSGAGSFVDANPMADVSLDGTGKYTLTETVTVVAPEKDGYTFKGWYCGYKWDSPKCRIYHFSDDLAVSISSKALAEKCNILTEYNRNSTGHIRLVAVYTPKPETTNLTLKLDKAPSGVKVDGGEKISDGTWSVPVGTEVTINASNVPGFQYWTNANDKVMSKEKTYKFTMVTDTTLEAVTSSGTTFVIFQSADGRLLKADTLDNTNEFPAAPYRVGYTFAGWKVGSAEATTELEKLKTNINSASSNGTVIVTAAYGEITAGGLSVTVYVDGSANTEMSKSNLSLGEIAMFTANQTANNKAFRFWASNVNGTNILSFSQTYSFRVTKDIEIYAIYGGENNPTAQPVVRVDDVLAKNESGVKSLTFMIGANVPEGYQLVEMGALYAKDSGTDAQLRVENVDNSTVRKAVSRLKHEPNLTDYSYALGFKISENNANSTIHLRGYVAVRKDNDNTIYYYYSGITSKSYSDFNAQ